MKQTRVVLVGMSQMMLSMIEGILAAHRDIRIAARFQRASLHPRRLRNIDVVIYATDPNDKEPERPDGALGLMFQDLPRKLLAIGSDGRRGVIWVLRPYPTTLSELSAETLLAAIREAI